MRAVDVLREMPPEVRRLTAAGDGPWSVAIYVGAPTIEKGAERLTCHVTSAEGSLPPAELAALIMARASGRS